MQTNRRTIRQPITTHEGAPARRVGALEQLRRSVLACLLWEREFYETGDEIGARILELADQCPPAAVAALAIEAREKQHLRHVPLLLVAALARSADPERRRVVGPTLERVVQRADELAEAVAIYWRVMGVRPSAAKGRAGHLPKQMKLGLAAAFQKFNEYHLSKHVSDEAEVHLRDVLFLCHAKPRDRAQKELWTRLIEGKLETADTWENALSKQETDEGKRRAWIRLIDEGALGGTATLKNLRNMADVGVPEPYIRTAIREAKVERVLPFQFVSAARHAPQFEDEIERLMLRNLAALPRLWGKTALVVDHSGSMLAPLSGRSELTRFDAAAAVAMLVREVCEQAEVLAFSSPMNETEKSTHRGVRIGFKYGEVRAVGSDEPGVDCGVDRPSVAVVPPRRGFALRDALERATCWWGTNTEDAKQLADRGGYDRIIVVTDEQSHQRVSRPLGRGYMVNVASARNGIGYGPWVHIDGWSEQVVRYVVEAEAAERSGLVDFQL